MMKCPRYFGYADVPEYHGRPLLSARDDAQYEFYCAWLADHLEQIASKPVPNCQALLCSQTDARSPDDVAFWLGHDGFYHLLTHEDMEGCLERGLSYENAEKELRVHWEDISRGVAPDEVEPFEQWISPGLWAEAKREYAEQHSMPLPVNHADIGYRVPLARALARVGSKAERIKLIKIFYSSFNEEASK